MQRLNALPNESAFPSKCLGGASSTIGDVLAVIVVRSTRDRDRAPGPVRARRGAATDNCNVGTIRVDGSRDTGQGEVGDGDTSGGIALEVTTIVVLLNQDTVVADGVKGDVLVSDARDRTSVSGGGLDTDTVHGVGDGGRGEGDGVDSVVVTSTNGADGKTVATGALTSGELDVGTRVDSNTVVLVLANSVGDGDGVGFRDVEAVSVLATVVIT